MMESRRLLCVSFRFPPQNLAGSIRAIKFVKYLARGGWKVDLLVPKGSITGDFANDLSSSAIRIIHVPCPKPFEAMLKVRRYFRRENIDSPTSRSVRTSSKPRIGLSSLLTYPDEAVWWHLFLRRAIRRYFHDHPDTPAIYVHGPPFTPFLTVLQWANRLGKHAVFDFRDPWSREPERRYRFAWMQSFVQKLERQILGSKHSILTVTEGLAEEFRQIEPSCGPRISVISNGFDPEDVPMTESAPNKERFILAHAGNLFTRTTETFLSSVKLAIQNNAELHSRIHVVFWGPVDPKTSAQVEAHGLNDICSFPGSIAHSQWLQRSREVSVFLLFQSYGPIDRIALPGKLFEYAALRRPILGFGWAGEAERMILERGWGWYFTPDQGPNQIAHRILDLYERWKSNQLNSFTRAETLRDVSRDTLTGKLEHILLGT